MSVGEKIRELRRERGMTGTQLAEKAGLDPSYLSKVEREKAGWSAEGLRAIAHALRTTPAALLDSAYTLKHFAGAYSVPVIDFIGQGMPSSGDLAAAATDAIACDLPDSTGLFAMTVRSGPMEPEFHEGDIVVFRQGLAPLPGDYVAAHHPAEGGTFRRFKDLGTGKDGQRNFALVPLNDDYASYRSDETEWSIVGTLVRHIRDYRKRA
jgi:transcriptional regulator with XRE-family HTH domain